MKKVGLFVGLEVGDLLGALDGWKDKEMCIRV